VSAALFHALDALAVPARVARGATLFRTGDDAWAAYTVRTGGLALLSAVPAQFAPMQIHGPQAIVGLPGVLTGVYSVTVRTSEDSEVGFLGREQVLALLGSDPRLCLDALSLVAEQVSRLRSILRATDVAANTRRLLLGDFRPPAFPVPVCAGFMLRTQEGY
jgi:CRP-like cAMP-binding protein